MVKTKDLSKKEAILLPQVLDILSSLGIEEEFLRNLERENIELKERVVHLETELLTTKRNFEYFDEQIKIISGNKVKARETSEEPDVRTVVEVDENASK